MRIYESLGICQIIIRCLYFISTHPKGAYLSGIGFIKGRFIQMEVFPMCFHCNNVLVCFDYFFFVLDICKQTRATVMNLFSSGQIVIVLMVLPNVSFAF